MAKTTKKTKKTDYVLTTPLAKLLREERVVSILPAKVHARPMSTWIERTKLSRQHFYMLLRGEIGFTERTLTAFAHATRLPEKEMAEIGARTVAAWKRLQKVLA